MRPDVARAFDRMERAARADGVALLDHQRLPLGRRAGRPLRAPSRPALGRAAGPLAAPPRHRARPRPARRLRLARRARRALPLQAALRVGAVALRLHAQRALLTAAASRRRGRRARCRASSRRVRAGARARRAALERLRHAARRAALRGEQLQPVRGQPRGRAGDRAVHARHRRRDGAARPVRRRAGDRRTGAPDARPAAPVPRRPARARRLQRRARRRSRPAGACPPTARRRATSRASSGSWAAPARAPRTRSRSGSCDDERLRRNPALWGKTRPCRAESVRSMRPLLPPAIGAADDPVFGLLLARAAAQSRPRRRADPHTVALVVEGGGMRGAVCAGMCVVLEAAGLLSSVDRVYGCSSGALQAQGVAVAFRRRWCCRRRGRGRRPWWCCRRD